MSKILPINTTSAVNAGKTFTIEVPVNITHEQIKLVLIDLDKSQVTDIKVKIGTKTIQEYESLQELDDFNDYYKRSYLNNIDMQRKAMHEVSTLAVFQSNSAHMMTALPNSVVEGGWEIYSHLLESGMPRYSVSESIFYFRRKEIAETAQRGITSLGLLNVPSCSIECKIAANARVGADIKVESLTTIAQPLGLITKVSRQTVPFVAAGWNDIGKMPKIGKILAYWFKKTNVDEVILKRDSVEIINATKESIESYAIAADSERHPVTNRFTTLDFTLDGQLQNGLEVLQYADGTPVGSVHAQLKLGTPGDVTVIAESLDSLSGA